MLTQYKYHVKYKNKFLLQFSWRRGFEDSRIRGFKCLFFSDLANALDILSL